MGGGVLSTFRNEAGLVKRKRTNQGPHLPSLSLSAGFVQFNTDMQHCIHVCALMDWFKVPSPVSRQGRQVQKPNHAQSNKNPPKCVDVELHISCVVARVG